jgi:hypothetical protein
MSHGWVCCRSCLLALTYLWLSLERSVDLEATVFRFERCLGGKLLWVSFQPDVGTQNSPPSLWLLTRRSMAFTLDQFYRDRHPLTQITVRILNDYAKTEYQVRP